MARRANIGWAVTGGAAAAAVVAVHGLTFQALKDVALLVWLVAIAARDARDFRIPNKAVVGVLATWAVLFLVEWLVLPGVAAGELSQAVWAGAGRALLASLLGACAAAGPVLLLTLVQAWRGREGFGGGDVKLLFAVGLWFSWPENLMGLFAACVAGVVIGLVWKARTGEAKLPFGPAILAGWFVVMLGGARLVAAVVG